MNAEIDRSERVRRGRAQAVADQTLILLDTLGNAQSKRIDDARRNEILARVDYDVTCVVQAIAEACGVRWTRMSDLLESPEE